MPLVILSGLPCSGKTKVAAKLEAKLQKLGLTTLIISESTLNLERNTAYKGNADLIQNSVIAGKRIMMKIDSLCIATEMLLTYLNVLLLWLLSSMKLA